MILRKSLYSTFAGLCALTLFLICGATPLWGEETEWARTPVIVIDPGHGGADPGSVYGAGTHGRKVREADIVLLVARRIAHILMSQADYEVFLTRSDDRFLSVRERRAIARSVSPDLFLSIHADAEPSRSANGASVFVLDPAFLEEIQLAELNPLRDTNPLPALPDNSGLQSQKLLVELALEETLAHSESFAATLLTQLEGRWPLLSSQFHREGFAVLKAPDMPSVLIELGFLSNDEDFRRLTNTENLEKISLLIAEAVVTHFHESPQERPL